MGDCRFCGKRVAFGSTDCEHCGAVLGKRDVKPPLTAGGTERYVSETTREARLFLIGLGVVFLVLWVSATATGLEFFEEQHDHSSLFYLLVLNRSWLLAMGAGLLGTGVLFWKTGHMAWAYLGGLVWFAVAWSPFACLATAPGALSDGLAPQETVDPLAGFDLIRGVLVWLGIALVPIYRFRDLAWARERLDERGEDL